MKGKRIILMMLVVSVAIGGLSCAVLLLQKSKGTKAHAVGNFDLSKYQWEIKTFPSDKNVGQVEDKNTATEKAKSLWLEKYGADAVVAEGMESGGHIGEQTTMTLVPQVVDAVSIPVIAAGGIADGRGIAAAFMLGAEAVQIGTRFVVSKESIVHENYKQRIIKAKDIDSTVTGRTHGHPVRCLRNQMTREYIKLEQEGKSFEELEYLTLGTLRKAVQEGDVANGTVMAGQIAGMITKEQTCKEMIDEMMEQAEKLLSR